VSEITSKYALDLESSFNDMRITLVGANHRSAPLELREKLSLTDEECVETLQIWIRHGTVGEALILSTCNRVEVVAVTPDDNDAIQPILDFLSNASSISKAQLSKHTYTYTDEQAVKHLFRVAASLDSMVIGEPQILGQLRRAYALASEAGSAGPTLHKLLPQAFM
jgi:glutamyl-tRNA reductase